MTLLLNGCSYGHVWQSFPGVNISKTGGSFYRSVRTTVEYCASNGNPNAVLIPITFIDRDEYITSISQDSIIEGPYSVSNSSTELKQLNETFNMLSDTSYATWDRFFLTLTLFCAWLEKQNIKYIIWDQCNKFNKVHLTGYKAINKFKYLEENKNIVDLFNFCANQYMYDNGAPITDPITNVPSYAHYEDQYYKVLVNYLRDYIKQNNLGIDL